MIVFWFGTIECKETDPLDIVSFANHYKENTYWTVNFVEKVRHTITLFETTTELKIASTIMYIVILIETLIFTVQYIKRVITMAMLTLIAPLVALTYPIDKITDGQAQGFNMWLREYIFNALLQPMHLILYVVIMSSASALVVSNTIYGIVALGCLIPMEKLLRKIFGFGKSESVGPFGGAAGAAVLMSTIGSLQKLRHRPPMRAGKEKDNELKLWNNNKSLDTEDILLGKPTNNLSGVNNNTPGKTAKVKPVPINKSKTNANKYASKNASKANANKNTSSKTPIPIRNMSSTSTTSSKTPDLKRTIKNPRLYALEQVGRSYGRKLTRKLTPGNIARNVAKVATGVALGGALGTVGLAAGIASGDLGNAMKYTATAGVAGATIGSSFAEKGADSLGNVKETYQNAYASVDNEYATNKRIKEFMKNEQNTQYIESRYTDKKERDEVYKVAEKAAEYGITEVQDVSAMYEMMKTKGLDVTKAIALSKMSKKIGDVSQPKTRKEYLEYFVSKGYSEDQAKTLLNNVESFQKERD